MIFYVQKLIESIYAYIRIRNHREKLHRNSILLFEENLFRNLLRIHFK
jgi:hypothetical protein